LTPKVEKLLNFQEKGKGVVSKREKKNAKRAIMGSGESRRDQRRVGPFMQYIGRKGATENLEGGGKGNHRTARKLREQEPAGRITNSVGIEAKGWRWLRKGVAYLTGLGREYRKAPSGVPIRKER